MFWAQIVHIDGSFYVVGGRTDDAALETTIAKLDANLLWSPVGDMQHC